MKVERLNNVLARIDALMPKAMASPSVVVGYTQRYALIVHENPDAVHGPGKIYKYLEIPVRQLSNWGRGGTLGAIVQMVYERTKDLEKALLVAGLRILRDSQEIVPVDTSALRASGYVCLEHQHEAVASAAFTKSETVRESTADKRAMKKRSGEKKRHKRRVEEGIRRQTAWEERNQ